MLGFYYKTNRNKKMYFLQVFLSKTKKIHTYEQIFSALTFPRTCVPFGL